MFYKIIYDHIVIDIVKDPNWVLWLKKAKIFTLTDETTANGIVSSSGEEVYHLNDTEEFLNCGEDHKTVVVIQIDESEYSSLQSQITKENVNEDGTNISLDELKSSKISEMSNSCENIICSGFDAVLSDGIQHHFSLEISDQLKISKLNDRANAGENFLPYHADDEPCKIYSAEDIALINNTMEGIIEYQTTYFNSLKIYINSMNDRDNILDVKYGMDIPESYQSDVLKMLIAQMRDTDE